MQNLISTSDFSIVIRELLDIRIAVITLDPAEYSIVDIFCTGTVHEGLIYFRVRREAVLISFDFSRLSLLCRLCSSGGYGCILRFCCDLRKIGAYRLGRCSYLRLVGRYGDSRLCCLGCSRCGFRSSGFFFPPMSVRSMSCALLEQPLIRAVVATITAAVTSLSVVCVIFLSSLV